MTKLINYLFNIIGLERAEIRMFKSVENIGKNSKRLLTDFSRVKADLKNKLLILLHHCFIHILGL